MRVWIVYLHEDKCGPEWEYVEAVFSTSTLAVQYMTDREDYIAELNEDCPWGSPYSYKIEAWDIDEEA